MTIFDPTVFDDSPDLDYLGRLSLDDLADPEDSADLDYPEYLEGLAELLHHTQKDNLKDLIQSICEDPEQDRC